MFRVSLAFGIGRNLKAEAESASIGDGDRSTRIRPAETPATPMTTQPRVLIIESAAVLPARSVRIGDSRVFVTAGQARRMLDSGAYELNQNGTVIREIVEGGRPTTARGYDSGRLQHLEHLRRVPVANWRELIRERRNRSAENDQRAEHVRKAHNAARTRNRDRAAQARMDSMARARGAVAIGS